MSQIEINHSDFLRNHHDKRGLLNIKVLTPTDAGEYKRLRLASLQNNPEAFGSSFEEEADQPHAFFEGRLSKDNGSLVWGAFQKNELVGTVGFLPESMEKLKHKGSVVGVYVAPHARGKGVARKLMQALFADLKHGGTTEKAGLRVAATNTVALKFYQTMGFREIGLEKDAIRVDGISYDEILMERYL